ncbi:MAG: putative lipid II flippase FtsW [Candidatus Omnitrophica bacterium]|nr:putative lipid II flippase FtsW [Candidatus Omnitrophota bacterium]
MRELRISIATICLALICLGVIMVFSTSGIYALQGQGDSFYYLKRHLIFLILGFAAACGIMAADYRDLRKIAKPMMVITIILLVLVLIPHIGKSSYGARRWFKLGFFNFQPTEFAKIAMIVYVADFLARKPYDIKSFRRGFVPLMIALGLTCVLILKQPDLGSAFLIGITVLAMFFIAGGQIGYLGLLGLMAIPGFYFLVVQVPYRWARIATFLDPWQDRQGAGFQLTQSQIAFGSGGLFGVGLGHSIQKLFYLPAAHTDFVLSIIGEEMGFVGAFTVILLFGFFIWQGARVAKRTKDPFGYYLVCGIVIIIGLQAVINIGVTIGALPTKGLPLPFISYGGSALVVDMMLIGLLLNVSRIEDCT